MNLESQQILTDLRTVISLEKDEWLQTRRDEEGKLYIFDTYTNTYFNNLHAFFKVECWDSQLECLKTLYCELIPKLVKSLMEKQEYKDLENLDNLLIKSVEGLTQLMTTYDTKSITNHLVSIKKEYAETIHQKIKEYLLIKLN